MTAQEIRLLRKITFSFSSKDQGWSDDTQHHGTFSHSWTWFEAAVTGTSRSNSASSSPDPTLNGRPVKKAFELQRNRHAGQTYEHYAVAFEQGDPQMSELKEVLEEGDVIELKACAKFPGWANHVEEAMIQVWSLDDLASEYPLEELGQAVTDGQTARRPSRTGVRPRLRRPAWVDRTIPQ